MTPDAVRALRIALGYTSCWQAAQTFGVETSTWQKWERGTYAIPPLYARVLQLCADDPDLLSELEEMAAAESEA